MNYELQTILRQIAGRILFTIPLFILGRYALTIIFPVNGEEGPTMYTIIWSAALALICFGSSGFMLAKPVALLIAYPIANLFYPTQSIEVPPPLYSVPEWLAKENRFEEAAEEYERIVHNHPQELQAHLALIDIYQNQLKDRERESNAYKRAMKCLRKRQDRDEISKTQKTNLGEL